MKTCLAHCAHTVSRIWASPGTRLARVLLIGVLGGWLGILLWGGRNLSFNLASIHGEIRPAIHGKSTIALPPFGTISAETHRAPVELFVRIDELHVNGVMRWVREGATQGTTIALLRRQLTRFAGLMALQSLGVAGLSALCCCLLLGGRRGLLPAGTLAGVVGVAVPLAWVAVTFRPTAFTEPTFHGELARAPELMQAAQLGWRNYNTFEEQLPLVMERVIRFYRRLDAVALTPMPPEEKLTRVLQISDLHNNPLALKFASDLAREYRVDLVAITGDMSDLGHPLEAEALRQWPNFHAPLVVISGNHDSRTIMQAMRHLPDTTVLEDGETVTRAGLTLMGFGDPAAERAGMGSVNPTAQELAELRERIETRLTGGLTPDLLLVHNPRVARQFLRRVPVVLTGHTHAVQLLRQGAHTLINPGTTGAAGLRYFTGPRQAPYGAALLYFTKGKAPKLQMVDMIAMEMPTGNFTIHRCNIGTEATAGQVRAENLWPKPPSSTP